MDINHELERSLILERSRADTLLQIFTLVCDATNSNQEFIVIPYYLSSDHIFKKLKDLGFSVEKLNEGQLQVSGWFIEEEKEK